MHPCSCPAGVPSMYLTAVDAATRNALYSAFPVACGFRDVKNAEELFIDISNAGLHGSHDRIRTHSGRKESLAKEKKTPKMYM